MSIKNIAYKFILFNLLLSLFFLSSSISYPKPFGVKNVYANFPGDYIYGWTYQVGGGNFDIDNWDLDVDSSGNVFVSGYADGINDWDQGPGLDLKTVNTAPGAWGYDPYLLKISNHGNYEFTRLSYLSIGYDASDGISKDSSDNVYIVGYYRSDDYSAELGDFFASSWDFDTTNGIDNKSTYPDDNVGFFITKYADNGDYGWTKTVGSSNSDIYVNDIAVDPSDNFYVAGQFRGTDVDFDPGEATDPKTYTIGTGYAVFLSKYDSDANYLWTLFFGPGDIKDIKFDPSGNVYLRGTFNATVDFDPGDGDGSITSNNNSTDLYVSKFLSDGTFVWARAWGGAAADYADGQMQVDSNGNVYSFGEFSGTNFDLDPTGNTDLKNSVANTDLYLLKMSTDGAYSWGITIDGLGREYAMGLDVDSNDNPVFTGYYSGETDFDAASGVDHVDTHISTNNTYDIFVCSYDTSGSFIFAQTWGGTGTDRGKTVYVDSYDNIYVGGEYLSSPVDLNPFEGEVNEDIFTTSAQTTFVTAFYNTSNPYTEGTLPTAKSYTTTQYSSSPALLIPDDDPGGATDSIEVTDDVAIYDLAVHINMTHTYPGDINMKLTNVDNGESAWLVYDGFGCGLGDTDDTILTFDSVATETAGDYNDACDADVTVRQDDVFFRNQAGNPNVTTSAGTWELFAVDTMGGDEGTLNSWSIEFTVEDTSAPTPTPTPTPTQTPTPTPTPSQSNSASVLSAASAPTCNDTSPLAPYIYTANVLGSHDIELLFSPPTTNVDKYVLFYGTQPGNYIFSLDNIDPNSKSIKIGSLAPSTKYYFALRSGKGCAISPASNEISATTDAYGNSNSGTNYQIEEITPQNTNQDNDQNDDNSNGTNKENNQPKTYGLSITINDGNKTVKGASVSIEPDGIQLTSDENGRVLFDSVSQGEHTITVKNKGSSGSQTVYLSGDNDQFNIEITLKKDNKISYILIFVFGVILVGFTLYSTVKRNSSKNK